MPYQSDKQRRFLHARHPTIAAKWDREGFATQHHSHHPQNPTGSTESSLDHVRRRKSEVDDMLHTAIRGLLRDVGDDT